MDAFNVLDINVKRQKVSYYTISQSAPSTSFRKLCLLRSGACINLHTLLTFEASQKDNYLDVNPVILSVLELFDSDASPPTCQVTHWVPHRYLPSYRAFKRWSNCCSVGLRSSWSRSRHIRLYLCLMVWKVLYITKTNITRAECEPEVILKMLGKTRTTKRRLFLVIKCEEHGQTVSRVVKLFLLFLLSATALGDIEEYAYVQCMEETNMVHGVYKQLGCACLRFVTTDEEDISLNTSWRLLGTYVEEGRIMGSFPLLPFRAL